MKSIRQATAEDLARIAEIEIFNYRLNFYPIFRSDYYYFEELQVPNLMHKYKDLLEQFWVYDDGAVKGFLCADGKQLKKLFVEPVLQGNGIGAKLLDYAAKELHIKYLWALEKNKRAIAFYQRHGFRFSGEKKLEEDTTEHLLRMER